MSVEDKDAAIAWERAVLGFDLIDGLGQLTHANPAAKQRGNVEEKVRAFWLGSDPEMASLGQAKARAQRQHSLSKGIVVLTIGMPRHRRALCLPRDPAASPQKCEATGKKDATCWRLTSPGTLAILRDVGCSPGDCVARAAGPR
jgi:hypothetical protein